MKRFEFELILTVDATSKVKAKELAQNAIQNLQEMMGYSPFSCRLELIEDSINEVDFDEDEDY